MDSLSVNPAALHASGWDVSDACYGSRFASTGHRVGFAGSPARLVGESGAAPARLRGQWQAANTDLHRDVDSLADGMRSAANGFLTSERHPAHRRRPG